MATLLDLADRLDKISADLGGAANDGKKQCALTILGDLAYGTPVDTSKAISNWQTTLNTPAEATIEPYFAGKHGSTYSESADATFANGRAVINGAQPGQPIYITNLLPYIGVLNDGSSSQAPAGFVERAVMLGRRFAQSVRIIRG